MSEIDKRQRFDVNWCRVRAEFRDCKFAPLGTTHSGGHLVQLLSYVIISKYCRRQLYARLPKIANICQGNFRDENFSYLQAYGLRRLHAKFICKSNIIFVIKNEKIVNVTFVQVLTSCYANVISNNYQKVNVRFPSGSSLLSIQEAILNSACYGCSTMKWQFNCGVVATVEITGIRFFVCFRAVSVNGENSF